MQTASLSVDHVNDVLARLPSGIDLTALAFDTKAIERCREIRDGASLLRLAFARGPGGLSLSQTAAWAGMIGLTELSSPGVKYRVDKAAGFLDALVSRLLADATQGTPVHWPGRILRAADGSGISHHASQGLDWRVHGVFDLGCGRFSHLALTDLHGAESMAHGAPLAGEIRIGDRNYARASIAKLAARASRAGPAVRRHDPGFPGIFPLRTCSPPTACHHQGACKKPPACCCWSPSSAPQDWTA